jgi:hypothetical protein
MALVWDAPKDPDEIKDYVLEWALLLIADTIATSIWIVPSGIVKNSDSHTNDTTTIWLSGGTAGAKYLFTNRITTTGGRTYDRTVKLTMKSL